MAARLGPDRAAMGFDDGAIRAEPGRERGTRIVITLPVKAPRR